MILYGSNSPHLLSKNTRPVKCINCSETTQFQIDIFGKYSYEYWVTFFSIGKIGSAQCSNCNTLYKPKDMSDTLLREYGKIRDEAKTPIKYFSGMILAVIIGIIAFGFSINTDKNTEEYLASPQVGDIYKFETKMDYYSTMKLVQVSDSIYFHLNKYETNKKSDVGNINRYENYYTAKMGYTAEMLNNLYDDNVIYEIKRKLNEN